MAFTKGTSPEWRVPFSLEREGRRLFGPKTWDDVRVVITKRLGRKFPGARFHDVEDAVATAIMNLFAVWRNYDSTKRVEESAKLFAFAIAWGTWRAQQYLAQELEVSGRLVSLSERVGRYEDDQSELQHVIPCELPSPEDLLVEAEEAELIAELIDSMPVGDRRRWLDPLLAGEGVRAQARREGQAPMTVQNNRARTVAFCRKRLERVW